MTNQFSASEFFTRKPFTSWADAAFDGRKTGIYTPPTLLSREVLGDHVLVKRAGRPWEVSRLEPVLPEVPFELTRKVSPPEPTELEMELAPYAACEEDEHIAFTADGELVTMQAW